MSAWWVRISRFARPEAPGLAALAALTVLGVALAALKPWPLKLVIDTVLAGDPLPAAMQWLGSVPGAGSAIGLLAWLAAGTVLVFIAARLVEALQVYVRAGVGTRMVYSLAEALFDHLQRLSLRYHGSQRTGDLIERVTSDSSCMRELVFGVYIPILAAVTSLVTMFAVMWKLDAVLALVALTLALPVALVGRLFFGRLTAHRSEERRVKGDLLAAAEQTLTALPIVKGFAREAHEDARFREITDASLRTYLRTVTTELQFNAGVGSVTAAGTAVVMFLGGLHVLQGTLTVGSLLVFLSYLAALYAPIETLAFLSQSVAYSSASARRVLEVLDAEPDVREMSGADALPRRAGRRGGHVRLEGVTFGYEPGRPVLENVSLEARPGETVALVGATGAGKSTLVSLIPRFVDPWQGRVLFDGRDVRTVTHSSLRSQIALVLQDAFLLPLTAAQNIAYGRPDAARDEIVAAAAAASAHDFVRQLPEGYDTVIGERGATLSGGQRQRLAIARALLMNAPVLILDEPTSALDAETEAELIDALRRLMKGRTTFIIAHRLSTIRHADRIVVLEEGKAVEQGGHDELLSRRGKYRRMYGLQVTGDVGAIA